MKEKPHKKSPVIDKVSTIWDYVFTDDRSIFSTVSEIIQQPTLSETWATIRELQHQHPDICQTLFASLSQRLGQITSHIQKNPELSSEESQLLSLQVYQLLCFLTYTEPQPGQTIEVPIFTEGDTESPAHWQNTYYSIQPVALCGRSDDPYCAYSLTPLPPNENAPTLLLFPGTAPLPWHRGAYMTYASDIAPYHAVGANIYNASKNKLQEILSPEKPTIAIGHSLGGAICGMLAQDFPSISIRAFSPPLSLSYSTAICSALLHLACISILVLGFLYGFPALTVVGSAALVLVTAPLLYTVISYTLRNISALLFSSRPASDARGPDHLAKHLLITQENDLVSSIGDKNYTPESRNYHLTHKGRKQDFIRAHTKAFSHLKTSTLRERDLDRNARSFNRILTTTYWEMLVKPCSMFVLYLYFRLVYVFQFQKKPPSLEARKNTNPPLRSQYTHRTNPARKRSASAPAATSSPTNPPRSSHSDR